MAQHPIAAFLTARLDELEEKARAAAAASTAPWRLTTAQDDFDGDVLTDHTVLRDADGLPIADDRADFALEELEQFAAHEPTYVLADIAAKRLIVEDFRWWWDQPDQPPTDAELHARCSHPGWEYATTEGPRKAWDDADVPPAGDGWERNNEVGWNGWERYDHFEESYWRRRRTPEDAEQRRAKAGRPPLTLRALAQPFAQHPDYQETWKP